MKSAATRTTAINLDDVDVAGLHLVELDRLDEPDGDEDDERREKKEREPRPVDAPRVGEDAANAEVVAQRSAAHARTRVARWKALYAWGEPVVVLSWVFSERVAELRPSRVATANWV